MDEICTLFLGPLAPVHLVLVGVGGTGSWLAPHVARCASLLHAQGTPVDVTFVDPDHVAPTNLVRQNFCLAELGLPKAQTLATRLTLALGVPITPIIAPFTPELVPFGGTTFLLGSVDNATARLRLHAALQRNHTPRPHIWYLDGGNGRDHGQVLLGCLGDGSAEAALAWTFPGRCTALPSPLICEPGLRIPAPDELQPSGARSSCAEQADQSPTINLQIAAIMADYLFRLVGLVPGGVTRFATEIAPGVMASRPITRSAIAAIWSAWHQH